MSHVIILSLKKFLVNFKFILIFKQQKIPGGSGSQTVDYYQNIIKKVCSPEQLIILSVLSTHMTHCNS